MKRIKKKWKRAGIKNKHHIKNKVNGGDNDPANLIILDMERHNAWHQIFKNLSFLEAAQLLIRADRIKKAHLISH